MSKSDVYSLHFFGTALELRLFLGSLVLGMLMGALFDIFRAIRISVRHPALAVFCEDVLYAVLFGLSYYTYCTALCRGEIRGFVLIGMLLGFFTYIVTLGRILCGFVAKAVNFVKIALKKFGRLLKNALSVLFGITYFSKNTKKFQENPCTKPPD